jgi:hypothetical protein
MKKIITALAMVIACTATMMANTLTDAVNKALEMSAFSSVEVPKEPMEKQNLHDAKLYIGDTYDTEKIAAIEASLFAAQGVETLLDVTDVEAHVFTVYQLVDGETDLYDIVFSINVPGEKQYMILTARGDKNSLTDAANGVQFDTETSEQ